MCGILFPVPLMVKCRTVPSVCWSTIPWEPPSQSLSLLSRSAVTYRALLISGRSETGRKTYHLSAGDEILAHYTRKDGLNVDVLYQIRKDAHGDIWILGQDKHVFRLDTAKGKLIPNQMSPPVS